MQALGVLSAHIISEGLLLQVMGTNCSLRGKGGHLSQGVMKPKGQREVWTQEGIGTHRESSHSPLCKSASFFSVHPDSPASLDHRTEYGHPAASMHQGNYDLLGIGLARR